MIGRSRDNGFIETPSTAGKYKEKFPITGTLSIGIATNKDRSFTHFGEMTEIASEMKRQAKRSWGSCYLTNRRIVPLETRRHPIAVSGHIFSLPEKICPLPKAASRNLRG